MSSFAKDFVTRGRFLGALTAALAAVFPGRARGAEPTDREKANLRLVTQFCESFASRDMTRITSFMAENCVYRITETAPSLTGAAAVERIREYVQRAEKVEFKILEGWVKGSIVVNERIDTFVSPQNNRAFHLTGVFFVKDGKIAEWTDYGIR